MIKEIKKVIVLFNNEKVGTLAAFSSGIAFQYDEKWQKYGFSISPFSLPLSNRVYTSKKNTFDGLYGVFWDSLPDGWGELSIKRYLAKQGINYDRLTPLTKLSLINDSGLGGLSYLPAQCEKRTFPDSDFDRLASDIKKVISDEYNGDFDEVFLLGGSSGGARPKAHIKIDDEEWIIKFACKIDPADIGEKEYNANMLARKCGITIGECKLFPSEICNGYFGSKRFDRKDDKRVHIISLAALLETTHRIPNLDYIHLFQVIENICADKNDLYEAFKRMCFNVYFGNKDDHSKNFAFLYDENINGYKLSPAYDITATLYKTEHEMTVNGNVNPTEDDIMTVSDKFGLSKAESKRILQEIKSITAKVNK